MVTRDELRRLSNDFGAILGEIMETQIAATEIQNPERDRQFYERAFVKHLYAIEDETEALSKNDLTNEAEELFAAANQNAVLVSGHPAPSIHAAILELGHAVDIVASDVVTAAFPDCYKPGVEYICPKLCCETDLMAHIDVAIKSFLEFFPPLEKLNELSALRFQELSKAIATLPPEQNLTPDDARQKFCFDEWQRGKTLKEINAALEKHATWDAFADERSVRSARDAWGERIGVTPRAGQPGRPAAKAD